MHIEELLVAIESDPDCTTYPPAGMPVLDSTTDKLPDDLQYFYSRCGGAELFINRYFGSRIVPPNELKPANPILTPFDYEKMREIYENDISAHWYLLFPSGDPGENIVIDLHPDRNGYCYDGYAKIYASSDEVIVAKSFTEAVEGLMCSRGEDLFWENRSPLGFIYEGLDIEPPHG